MHKTAIIDEISASKDYEYVLMTSFTFDINYFEQAILNKLIENDVRRILLFLDLKQFNSSLVKSTNFYLGKKYSVTPIQMNGAFHPKVILFLGKEKAKVIIGSANIQPSGYVNNNEVFNSFEYSSDTEENLSLIKQTIDFFISINDNSFKIEKSIFEDIKKLSYYRKNVEIKSPILVDSMGESVINKVLELIEEEVEAIDIAVPYYDKGLNALKIIKEKFPKAKCSLYIQNDRSTFPVEYNNVDNVVSAKEMKIFSKIEETNNSNFYHGKVIRFKTKNNSYALYGSSNCTGSALTKSFEKGGNIECNVFEKGNLLEFDDFYSNFIIEEECILKSENMIFKQEETNNFTFKYGVLKDELKLTLGYKNQKNDLLIKLNEKKLKYEYDEKYLIVYVPKILVELENDVFDINLLFDGDDEVVRCWYNDLDSIEHNRESDSVKQIKNINFEYENENYIEDMKILIQAMMMNNLELEKNKEFMRLNFQKSDIPEDSDEDDFIVDYDFSDEYIEKERNFKILETVRKNVVSYFYKKTIQSGTVKKDSLPTDDGVEKTKRIPTTEEKRFERFIKSRVKGMIENEYVESIEWEHFYENIIVLISIFEKYYDEPLFEENYVINTKLELLHKLLEKKADDLTEEKLKLIILLTIKTILENHFDSLKCEERDYRIELKNKDLLKKLNDIADIRETFDEHLKIMFNSSININFDYNSASDYLEKLFGYKTTNKLIEYIKNIYGEECVVELNEEQIYIECNADDLKQHFRDNITLLKEIKNYAINEGGLSIVKIKINNAALNSSFPNPPLYIKFLININNGQSKRIIFSKNGNRQEINNYLRGI